MPGKLLDHVQKIDTPERAALRDGFGKGMLRLGEADRRIVALCADLTDSDRLEWFKEKWPERFVEVGIAEQNLIAAAAGMSRAGKIPFAASFAAFSPGRSWDQIRVAVCYSKNNVKIYGGHAGITAGEDGATHQALEDIAITRCLPEMTVLVPADAIEMEKATIAAGKAQGPFYLRGGRPAMPPVTTRESPFEVGRALLMRTGDDCTIIACGHLVREALIAAEALAKRKIGCRVLNMHTIKPLDEPAIAQAAADTGCIVTAEEHQVTGGLGSAVAEALARHAPVPLEMVGVRDMFCESGRWDELMDKYGLRASDIMQSVHAAIERKRSKGIAQLTQKKAAKRTRTKKR